uniref:(California timema) hypothetical protein n=1 Tax=Timema californicum TaxID=61474 RepID=A0A7R9PFJ0_TIMCA|nr:unnamed protein product [Timema californicum]
MQRESQKDRTILCKFDPTEPGDYRVEVKWAGEHVPGSAFGVMIFDTQEELNRFIQGNHSPGQSEVYGSVGYSTGYAHINFGGLISVHPNCTTGCDSLSRSHGPVELDQRLTRRDILLRDHSTPTVPLVVILLVAHMDLSS